MLRLQCEKTGESVDLLKQLNSSGEGVIYTTNKSGFLAKIYHDSTPERIEKLRVMVSNPPVDPTQSQGHISIAWPKYVLEDSDGKPLGFLMPEIKDAQTLINVYNPKRREKKAAGFNWMYLHVTAMNIAYIVHAVHIKNYVIGDIKQQNLLVKSDGRVAIIDTDSFQIRDPVTGKIHRGHVGSQEYTPPEMFNVDFSKVDRSELQDRFGLAIIIWQLLFASHPFTGQWVGGDNQPNIDRLIQQGDWIYGAKSNLRPTQLSIPLEVVHPELERLFHRCFDDGCHKPYARPSAFEWQEGLKTAISFLKHCQIETGHHYAENYGRCYWCERKKRLGYDVFPSIQGATITPIPTIQPNSGVVTPSPILLGQPKLSAPVIAGLVIGALALTTGQYWILIIACIFIIINRLISTSSGRRYFEAIANQLYDLVKKRL
jgi:DNA-binding helix-hairpin-helix protein with protein kinase domain